MKVKELIIELQKHDPEAEVHVPSNGVLSDTTEADEVWASTATYGVLLPEPTTVPTVVIDYAFRGL